MEPHSCFTDCRSGKLDGINWGDIWSWWSTWGNFESQSRHTSGRVYEVLGLWVSYLGKVVICLSERSDWGCYHLPGTPDIKRQEETAVCPILSSLLEEPVCLCVCPPPPPPPRCCHPILTSHPGFLCFLMWIPHQLLSREPPGSQCWGTRLCWLNGYWVDCFLTCPLCWQAQVDSPNHMVQTSLIDPLLAHRHRHTDKHTHTIGSSSLENLV